MKLVKKIFASACALAMAVTAISSLSVTAFAAGVPTLTGDISVNTEAKTADITVYVKDIPSDIYTASNTYITSMGISIGVEGYSTIGASEDDIWDFLDAGKVTPAASAISTEPSVIASTKKRSLYTSCANLAQAAAIAVNAEKVEILKITGLPLTDEAVKNGFTVDIAGNDDAKGAQIMVKRRSNITGEWVGNATNNALSVVDPSWKPATTEDPKPDYVYDEKNPSATNWKAADTDVAPSVYEGTDGSKAVGAKATVNPGSDKNTYTGLVWKVKSADGAKTYTYTQGVNITGAADFVYGIVINGATESDVDLNSFGVAVK